VASELGHAALDSVVLEIERKFDRNLQQMVGAMLKRVLESRGLA